MWNARGKLRLRHASVRLLTDVANITPLIADDNTHTQRLLHTALGSCDFRTVSDAGQAFTIATAESPDLIVANVAVPGFDSFEMVQQLKV